MQEEWRQDWDVLRGRENEIIEDESLAESLFDSFSEAFDVGYYLGLELKREEAESAELSEPSSWGPRTLYGREPSGRRVLFLELMAWAILRVETFHTRAEAQAFFKELKETREEHWGARPWAYAARGSGAYLTHVREMADVFANAPSVEEANYANRQKHPLAQYGETAVA